MYSEMPWRKTMKKQTHVCKQPTTDCNWLKVFLAVPFRPRDSGGLHGMFFMVDDFIGSIENSQDLSWFFGQSISIAKTSVQQPDSPFTVYDLWACDWTTHGKEYAVRGQIGRILPCWNKRPLHPVGGGHNLCPTISRLVPNELQQCSCSRFNRIGDLAHVASIYHHQSWLVMKNTNWGNPYQWCQITHISKVVLVEICLTAQQPYQDHKWQQEMA